MRNKLRISKAAMLGTVLLFLINGAIWWYFRSYLNFMIAVFMILAVVLSGVLLWCGRDDVEVKVVLPASAVGKGIAVPGSLEIVNRRKYLLYFVDVNYTLLNIFTGEREETLYQGTAYPAVLRELRSGRGYGRKFGERILRMVHYGNLTARVTKLRIYDIFHLFYIEKTAPTESWMIAAPGNTEVSEPVERRISSLMPEASLRKSADYSADYEIREYRPQDDMRDIHWKLTAKQGKLMVRERLSDGKPMVNVLLSLTTMPEENDLRMEVTEGLCRLLLGEKYPIKLYWSVDAYTLKVADISSVEELETAIYEILSGPGNQRNADTAELFAMEHPGEQSIHVGGKAVVPEQQAAESEVAVRSKGKQGKRRDKQNQKREKVSEKLYFPWGEVLTKAVLITLLIIGSVGGLLSAYHISYNILGCVLLVFGMSVIFAAAYATGRRLVINFLLLGSLAGFFAFAIRSFWYVNSGYYSVLNRIMEIARVYLGIFNGTEYVLTVENEHFAVTYFVIFVGIIEVLLFSIHFSKAVGVVRVLLLTFPLYCVPLYFDESPGVIYVLMLFAGYFLVLTMRAGRKSEERGRQLPYQLALAGIFAICCRMLLWGVPQQTYLQYVSANPLKEETEKQISAMVQSGIMSAFNRGGSAGISGGTLGNGGSVSPDYETDLIVEFTPYSYDPIYLKAYEGMVYDGQRWASPMEFGVDSDFMMEETLKGLQIKGAEWAQGVMRVQNVGADAIYPFYPYYTDAAQTKIQSEKDVLYTYYPRNYGAKTETAGVAEGYLEVPERCADAVQAICAEAGFVGDAETVAAQIVDFFAENYSYTLSPGYNWTGTDYITHFLNRSKRGYCMHFASAGTMLLRQMGIPARYVEGYVFSYTDVVVDGELVPDAEYADYYSGYSLLGETGLVRIEIPDANAHAWVEIYVEGKGWLVVDPTPAATSTSAENESFWDAFRQQGLDMDGGGSQGADAEQYLEQVINGTARLVMVSAVVLMFFLIGRLFVNRRRELALPTRKRVQLRYRNLISGQMRKNEEMRRLDTVERQLAFLHEKAKSKKGTECEINWDKLEANLYQAFYGPELTDAEYHELCRYLQLLSRRLRWK